jgi:colanic acid/amylovoran biosynthesis protein
MSQKVNEKYNIHIIHNYTSLNTGWATIVLSTVNTFKQILPNSTFTIESYDPNTDKEIYENENITVIDKIIKTNITAIILIIRALLWRFFIIFNIDSKLLINTDKLLIYKNSDVFLDLGGDNLSVPLKTTNLKFKIKRNIIGILGHTYLFVLLLLLKKKIVLYAQTIGPLGPLKSYIKYLLNKMSLITVREEESLKYVNKLKLKKAPVHLTADPAFILPTAPKEQVDKLLKTLDIDSNLPLVGICLSSETARYHYKESEDDLQTIFSKICEKIVDEYNTQVLLIPFSTWEGHGGDDRKIARTIWDKTKSKNMIKLIQVRFDPRLTKAIISRCNAFIGSRGHSMMIALSSCTPTIAIGHNPKYYGIMKMAGQEKYVYKADEITYEKLYLAFKEIWSEKENIEKTLKTRMNEIQELAKLNAELVKNLLI